VTRTYPWLCLVDARRNCVLDWMFQGVDGMVRICVSLSKDSEWAINAENLRTSQACFLVGSQVLGGTFSDIRHSWILERLRFSGGK